MEIKKGINIEYEGQIYVVLSIIEEENIKYIFANKIENEEPTEEYMIFKENGEVVKEETLINRLLPKFQEDMKKDIESLFN